MRALWILFGAPCAGSYDSESSWPPPRTIHALREGRFVRLIAGGDIPADAVEYELRTYGLRAGGDGQPPRKFASYLSIAAAARERAARTAGRVAAA